MPVFRQLRETKWTTIVSDGQNFGKTTIDHGFSLKVTASTIIKTGNSVLKPCIGFFEHLPCLFLPRPENYYHVRLPYRML